MSETLVPKNGDNPLEPREYVLAGELRLRAGQSLKGVAGKTIISGLTRLYIRDESGPENLSVTGIIFKNVPIFMDHPNGKNEGVVIDNNEFVGANANITFTSGLKNSRITNNAFRDTSGHAIYGYNYEGLTIANNEIVNPGGGMHIDAQGVSSGLLVEQNIVDGASGFSFEFQGAGQDCVFQDNYAINPRLVNAASSFAFSLILDRGNNITIRRNYVSGTKVPGNNQIPRVAFEIGGDNTLVEDNHVDGAWDGFIDNDGNGTTSCTVRNNRMLNIGKSQPISLAFPGGGRTLNISGNGPSISLTWNVNRDKPGRNRRLDNSNSNLPPLSLPPTPTPAQTGPTQLEFDKVKAQNATLAAKLSSAVSLAKQIVASVSASTLLSMLLLVGITASGCVSKNTSRPIENAGNGVTAIVAHTNSAEQSVKSAVPHADNTGKTFLSVASAEHKAVLSEADQTRKSLDKAMSEADTLRSENAKLNGKWYVVWGKRIERAFWIIIGGWAVCGALSIVLGVGNPLGWGGALGKELVRLMPGSNPFAWIRDWISRRRAPRNFETNL